LDDGFQHWSLARNLNLVTLNALNPFGNGRLIPAGSLREPISALRSADVLVITHANLVEPTVLEALRARLGMFGQVPIVEAIHEPLYLYRARTGERVSLEKILTKRTMAFSGIGHPLSFEHTLKRVGVQLERSVRFSDHHRYTGWDLQHLKKEASQFEEVVTTEKDFLRSAELMKDTVNPLVLKIAIRITKGKDELHARLDNLLSR